MDTLQHEAAHCVVSLMQGHRIKQARVGGAVGNGLLGTVEIEEVTDAYGHLVATLAGPMACGQAPPPWPPDPCAPTGTDERAIASIVHVAGITREQYSSAAAITVHLLDDHRVKAAVANVAAKLGLLGSLTNIQVKDAVGEEFLNWIEAGT